MLKKSSIISFWCNFGTNARIASHLFPIWPLVKRLALFFFCSIVLNFSIANNTIMDLFGFIMRSHDSPWDLMAVGYIPHTFSNLTADSNPAT